MLCLNLPYPSFRAFSPVNWIASDDCELAKDFIEGVAEASAGFAANAKSTALAFINSVGDGRIIVTPGPIPTWPPL